MLLPNIGSCDGLASVLSHVCPAHFTSVRAYDANLPTVAAVADRINLRSGRWLGHHTPAEALESQTFCNSNLRSTIAERPLIRRLEMGRDRLVWIQAQVDRELLNALIGYVIIIAAIRAV